MATNKDVSTIGTNGEIRKVTVAGITGAIGVAVIEALYTAGLQVRALTRSTTAAIRLPAAVEVIEVDYTNAEKLEAALLGQDVVISALGDSAGAVAAQEALIYASLAVGVQRFFPSEFGSDTKNERVRSFPFFADKIRHQALLEQAAKKNPEFSNTIVITGPFLDWGLSIVPFIINVGTQSADVFDTGTVSFSTTRVTTLGRALVSCLQPSNFTGTANSTLYIHDAVITQNQLIALSQALPGTETPFERKEIDTDVLEKQAWTDYHAPEAHPLTWTFPFINLSIWSREALCVFQGRTDNAMLSIPEIDGEELDALLRTEIQKAKAALSGRGGDGMVDHSSVEKALEEGKKRLEGFGRARTESQVEGVAG